MTEARHRSLLAQRVLKVWPRLLLAAAGPGWGKTRLANELRSAVASSLYVGFRVAASLDGAKELVNQALGATPWERGTYDLIVFDDVEDLVNVGGAEYLSSLMATLPAGTTLMLTSGLPLEAIDVSQWFAPHEILSLRRDSFEIPPDEARAIIACEVIPKDLMERAVELSQGWPILVYLFARLAREQTLGDALSDLSSWRLDSYHRYMKMHVISRLPADEIDVFIACAALDQATADELSAALRRDARPALAEMNRKRYYPLRCVHGVYSLTEMPKGALLALYPQQVREMRLRAAQSHHEAGRHVRAAKLALEAGDYAFAAACLDATGRHAAQEAISADYQAVAERLPLEYVFRSRYVYLEYFCNRRVRVRPFDLEKRVKSFCNAMTLDDEPIVRYSACVALAAVLRMTLHWPESEAAARACDALTSQVAGARDRHALLRSERAVLASWAGKLDAAADLWAGFDEEEELPARWFRQTQISSAVAVALHRGDYQTALRCAHEGIEHARHWDDAAIVAQSETLALIVHACAGDFSAVRSSVARIETLIEGRVSDSLIAPMRERFALPHEREHNVASHAACLLRVIAAIGQADTDLRRRLLTDSIEGFDAFCHPYWQIAGRLAAAQTPEFDRQTLLKECVSLCDRMQGVPEVTHQVRAMAAGTTVDGPFTAFLRALAALPPAKDNRIFRVRLLDRTVTRGGAEIKLRAREFELLALLALAGGPVSAAALCESMWPDSGEQAAVASLRMSVSRLRKQLGDPSAVTSVPTGYQLDAHINVDILEAESAFVAMRRLPQLTADDRTSLHALFQYLCSVKGYASEHESWFEGVARRIEDVRHGAGVLLAKEYLRCEEPLKALEAAEALLRFDALDEEAVGLCVKALTDANDRPAAMRIWQQYVKRLSEDYGAQPAVSADDLLRDLGSGTARR